MGEEVRLRMAPDGHFWADVRLDGVERRMLIDSGATITALSQRLLSGLLAMEHTAQNGDHSDRGLQGDLWGPGMSATEADTAIVPEVAPASAERDGVD